MLQWGFIALGKKTQKGLNQIITNDFIDDYSDVPEKPAADEKGQMSLFNFPEVLGHNHRLTMLAQFFDRLPLFHNRESVYPSVLSQSATDITADISDVVVKITQQAVRLDRLDSEGNRVFRFPGKREKNVLNAIRFLAHEGNCEIKNALELEEKGSRNALTAMPFIQVTFTTSRIRTILKNEFKTKLNWPDIVEAVHVLKMSSLNILAESYDGSSWTQPLLGGANDGSGEHHRVYLHPLLSYSIVHGRRQLHLLETQHTTLPPDAQLVFNRIYTRYTQASTDTNVKPYGILASTIIEKTLGGNFGPRSGPDDSNRTRMKAFQRCKRVADAFLKENLFDYKVENRRDGSYVIDKLYLFFPTHEYVKSRVSALMNTKKVLGMDYEQRLSNDPFDDLPRGGVDYPEND